MEGDSLNTRNCFLSTCPALPSILGDSSHPIHIIPFSFLALVPIYTMNLTSLTFPVNYRAVHLTPYWAPPLGSLAYTSNSVWLKWNSSSFPKLLLLQGSPSVNGITSHPAILGRTQKSFLTPFSSSSNQSTSPAMYTSQISLESLCFSCHHPDLCCLTVYPLDLCHCTGCPASSLVPSNLFSTGQSEDSFKHANLIMTLLPFKSFMNAS